MGITIPPRHTLTPSDRLAEVIGKQGRIVVGTLNAAWTAAERAYPCGSLGLKALTLITLTGGTALEIIAHARVVSPGSPGNTARIKTVMLQVGSVRTGTPRYKTFSPAFTATPTITGMPGSPILAITAAQNLSFAVLSRKPGSFQHQGTPTSYPAVYTAQGPGSYPLNYIAIGY